MAIISSECNSTFSSVSCKWLLKREKLEEIASTLAIVNQQFFKFDYHGVVDEKLPALQEYCFKVVFEMCEHGMWSALTIRKDQSLEGCTVNLISLLIIILKFNEQIEVKE